MLSTTPDTIIKAYQSGLSFVEVSQSLSIPLKEVKRTIRTAQIVLHKPNSKFDAARTTEMIQLYEQGEHTQLEVAQHYGLSRNTFFRHCAKLGYQFKARGTATVGRRKSDLLVTQVHYLRQLLASGMHYQLAATHIGVRPQVAYLIASGKTYRHIK